MPVTRHPFNNTPSRVFMNPRRNLSEFNIVVCLNFSVAVAVAVDIGSGEVRRVKSDNAENMSALCDIIRGVDLAVAVHIAVNNHDEFVDNVAFRIIQRIHNVHNLFLYTWRHVSLFLSKHVHRKHNHYRHRFWLFPSGLQILKRMRNSHGKIQSAHVSALGILPRYSLSASHGICYVYADVCTAEYKAEGITHVAK